MNSADPRLPKLGVVRDRAEDARHLVEALVELGAAPVLELSGAELAHRDLAEAGLEVLVVGLGSEIETDVFDALDRVRIVFDDLEASAGLSGWDRSRWLRHLRAKLLGVAEDGPPRPAGAEPIPVRSVQPVDGGSAPIAASERRGPGDRDEAPVAAVGPESIGHESPTGEGGDRAEADEAVSAVDFAIEPQPAMIAGEASAEAFGELAEFPFSGDAGVDTVSFEESSGTEVADDQGDLGLIDFDEPSDVRATQAGVGGLDELLDALRRDQGRDADDEPLERSAAPIEADDGALATAPPALDRFDLSSLSLEPLDDERPVTGRARFVVDEAPRHELAVSPSPPKSTPKAKEAVRTAWFLAAGEADPGTVTSFLDALPAGLDALLLLVRPASAPWLGATVALAGSDRLPLVLGDDVMAPIPGRVVVLSPGERAGFDRAGQLTVQPGDQTMPEALGDWMTMRALAGRFGRDTGVIVFGRLRDEVLEGAIEVARAGGQVWFEASVLAESNPVADAAQAAGIAMRTGTAAELAAALIERLDH